VKYNRTELTTGDGQNSLHDLWKRVSRKTGQIRQLIACTGVTASDLNQHYAGISTENQYTTPPMKATVASPSFIITEMRVFHLLDHLRPTAEGIDKLPAWFLRIAAPFLAAPLSPLAYVFNLSLINAQVPSLWKTAITIPIPRTSLLRCLADFQPLSLLPVLSRMLEKEVVKRFIYPALTYLPPPLCVSHKYAFRPTGSTTAALINILHHISTLLLRHCPTRYSPNQACYCTHSR